MLLSFKTVIPALALGVTSACANPIPNPDPQSESTKMTSAEKVTALLNSFNTGETGPISYINAEKYIQHNLDVADVACLI